MSLAPWCVHIAVLDERQSEDHSKGMIKVEPFYRLFCGKRFYDVCSAALFCPLCGTPRPAAACGEDLRL